jgi:hypothetical protein
MISPAMITGETSWTRMSEGIEKVKARLRRATALLDRLQALLDDSEG